MNISTANVSTVNMSTHTLQSVDEDGLCALAAMMAVPACLSGSVICADGDLGSGKSTFFRALLRALGVRGAIKSPTYSLIEQYEVGMLTIAHCDLYRIHDPVEAQSLTLDAYVGAQQCLLLEWHARGGRFVPVPDLRVELTDSVGQRDAQPNEKSFRTVTLIAESVRGHGLLALVSAMTAGVCV